MTNSTGGLRQRLKQFDNSLNCKKPGHGGALRFKNDICKNEISENNFYVSLWPFPLINTKTVEDTVSDNECYQAAQKMIVGGLIAYVESSMIAIYISKHNKMPKYNNKKISPKYKCP
jgi:hypothetical protein